MFKCPNCNHTFLEPMFDLPEACRIIPMRYKALTVHLSRHKAQFPANYRRSEGGRLIRLLTLSECETIRRMTIGPRQPKPPRP